MSNLDDSDDLLENEKSVAAAAATARIASRKWYKCHGRQSMQQGNELGFINVNGRPAFRFGNDETV